MAGTRTGNVVRLRVTKAAPDLCASGASTSELIKTMNATKLTHSKVNKRRSWWNFLPPRQRQHDPMLVLNMSAFNFESGWNRVFSPIRRENVWGT
jgi:hypothetical protein